ncbi:MAG TPA: diaminopimelate epimerase [Pseudonocardiaceae bacterium]|jgi:diaminopimelate epimerase|nr:diaminopimelate epimerase [Pseudonocardiaceae bacterium]
MVGVEFLKGHGTQNDFVLLPDVDGALELTQARVRALCDRRRGIGADGVLRVVATDHVPDLASFGAVGDAKWFMDYRNADGSIAEMCGNGVRVFTRYLVEVGLAEAGEFTIATRAGTRRVVVPPADPAGTVTVEMGKVGILGRSTATVAGRSVTGVAVDVGNPHLVCALDGTGLDLAGLDLSVPPGHDPSFFPHGVNVEFVNQLSADALRMRVHERGVGETRSCGTGTVAAVAATLHLADRASAEVAVHVPGGTVVVAIDDHQATLTGPAVLVARGELDEQWWASANQPG